MSYPLHKKKYRSKVLKSHIYLTRKRSRFKEDKAALSILPKTTDKLKMQYCEPHGRILNYGSSVLCSNFNTLSFSWYILFFFQLLLCGYTHGLTSQLIRASENKKDRDFTTSQLIFTTTPKTYYETLDLSQIKATIQDNLVQSVFGNSEKLHPSFFSMTIDKSDEPMSVKRLINAESVMSTMNSQSVRTTKQNEHFLGEHRDSFSQIQSYLLPTKITSSTLPVSLPKPRTDVYRFLPIDTFSQNQDIPDTVKTISGEPSESLRGRQPITIISPTKTLNYNDHSLSTNRDYRMFSTIQRQLTFTSKADNVQDKSNINQNVTTASLPMVSLGENSDISMSVLDDKLFLNEFESAILKSDSRHLSSSSTTADFTIREQINGPMNIITSQVSPLQTSTDSKVKQTATSTTNDDFHTESLEIDVTGIYDANFRSSSLFAKLGKTGYASSSSIRSLSSQITLEDSRYSPEMIFGDTQQRESFVHTSTRDQQINMGSKSRVLSSSTSFWTYATDSRPEKSWSKTSGNGILEPITIESSQHRYRISEIIQSKSVQHKTNIDSFSPNYDEVTYSALSEYNYNFNSVLQDQPLSFESTSAPQNTQTYNSNVPIYIAESSQTITHNGLPTSSSSLHSITGNGASLKDNQFLTEFETPSSSQNNANNVFSTIANFYEVYTHQRTTESALLTSKFLDESEVIPSESIESWKHQDMQLLPTDTDQTLQTFPSPFLSRPVQQQSVSLKKSIDSKTKQHNDMKTQIPGIVDFHTDIHIRETNSKSTSQEILLSGTPLRINERIPFHTSTLHFPTDELSSSTSTYSYNQVLQGEHTLTSTLESFPSYHRSFESFSLELHESHLETYFGFLKATASAGLHSFYISTPNLQSSMVISATKQTIVSSEDKHADKTKTWKSPESTVENIGLPWSVNIHNVPFTQVSSALQLSSFSTWEPVSILDTYGNSPTTQMFTSNYVPSFLSVEMYAVDISDTADAQIRSTNTPKTNEILNSDIATSIQLHNTEITSSWTSNVATESVEKLFTSLHSISSNQILAIERTSGRIPTQTHQISTFVTSTRTHLDTPFSTADSLSYTKSFTFDLPKGMISQNEFQSTPSLALYKQSRSLVASKSTKVNSELPYTGLGIQRTVTESGGNELRLLEASSSDPSVQVESSRIKKGFKTLLDSTFSNQYRDSSSFNVMPVTSTLPHLSGISLSVSGKSTTTEMKISDDNDMHQNIDSSTIVDSSFRNSLTIVKEDTISKKYETDDMIETENELNSSFENRSSWSDLTPALFELSSLSATSDSMYSTLNIEDASLIRTTSAGTPDISVVAIEVSRASDLVSNEEKQTPPYSVTGTFTTQRSVVNDETLPSSEMYTTQTALYHHSGPNFDGNILGTRNRDVPLESTENSHLLKHMSSFEFPRVSSLESSIKNSVTSYVVYSLVSSLKNRDSKTLVSADEITFKYSDYFKTPLNKHTEHKFEYFSHLSLDVSPTFSNNELENQTIISPQQIEPHLSNYMTSFLSTIKPTQITSNTMMLASIQTIIKNKGLHSGDKSTAINTATINEDPLPSPILSDVHAFPTDSVLSVKDTSTQNSGILSVTTNYLKDMFSSADKKEGQTGESYLNKFSFSSDITPPSSASLSFTDDELIHLDIGYSSTADDFSWREDAMSMLSSPVKVNYTNKFINPTIASRTSLENNFNLSLPSSTFAPTGSFLLSKSDFSFSKQYDSSKISTESRDFDRTSTSSVQSSSTSSLDEKSVDFIFSKTYQPSSVQMLPSYRSILQTIYPPRSSIESSLPFKMALSSEYSLSITSLLDLYSSGYTIIMRPSLSEIQKTGPLKKVRDSERKSSTVKSETTIEYDIISSLVNSVQTTQKTQLNYEDVQSYVLTTQGYNVILDGSNTDSIHTTYNFNQSQISSPSQSRQRRLSTENGQLPQTYESNYLYHQKPSSQNNVIESLYFASDDISDRSSVSMSKIDLRQYSQTFMLTSGLADSIGEFSLPATSTLSKFAIHHHTSSYFKQSSSAFKPIELFPDSEPSDDTSILISSSFGNYFTQKNNPQTPSLKLTSSGPSLPLSMTESLMTKVTQLEILSTERTLDTSIDSTGFLFESSINVLSKQLSPSTKQFRSFEPVSSNFTLIPLTTIPGYISPSIQANLSSEFTKSIQHSQLISSSPMQFLSSFDAFWMYSTLRLDNSAMVLSDTSSYTSKSMRDSLFSHTTEDIISGVPESQISSTVTGYIHTNEITQEQNLSPDVSTISKNGEASTWLSDQSLAYTDKVSTKYYSDLVSPIPFESTKSSIIEEDEIKSSHLTQASGGSHIHSEIKSLGQVTSLESNNALKIIVTNSNTFQKQMKSQQQESRFRPLELSPSNTLYIPISPSIENTHFLPTKTKTFSSIMVFSGSLSIISTGYFSGNSLLHVSATKSNLATSYQVSTNRLQTTKGVVSETRKEVQSGTISINSTTTWLNDKRLSEQASSSSTDSVSIFHGQTVNEFASVTRMLFSLESHEKSTLSETISYGITGVDFDSYTSLVSDPVKLMTSFENIGPLRSTASIYPSIEDTGSQNDTLSSLNKDQSSNILINTTSSPEKTSTYFSVLLTEPSAMMEASTISKNEESLMANLYPTTYDPYLTTSMNVQSSSFLTPVSFKHESTPSLNSVLPADMSTMTLIENASTIFPYVKRSTLEPSFLLIVSTQSGKSIHSHPESVNVRLSMIPQKGRTTETLLTSEFLTDQQYSGRSLSSASSVLTYVEPIPVSEDKTTITQITSRETSKNFIEETGTVFAKEDKESLGSKISTLDSQIELSGQVTMMKSNELLTIDTSAWFMSSEEINSYRQTVNVKSVKRPTGVIIPTASSFQNRLHYSTSQKDIIIQTLTEAPYAILTPSRSFASVYSSSTVFATVSSITISNSENQLTSEKISKLSLNYSSTVNPTTTPQVLATKHILTSFQDGISIQSTNNNVTINSVSDTYTESTWSYLRDSNFVPSSEMSQGSIKTASSDKIDFVLPSYMIVSSSPLYNTEVAPGTIASFTNNDLASFESNGGLSFDLSSFKMAGLLPSSMVPTSNSFLNLYTSKSKTDVPLMTLTEIPYVVSSPKIVSSSVTKSERFSAAEYFISVQSTNDVNTFQYSNQTESIMVFEQQLSLTTAIYIATSIGYTEIEDNYSFNGDSSTLLISTAVPSIKSPTLKEFSSKYVKGSFSGELSGINSNPEYFEPVDQTKMISDTIVTSGGSKVVTTEFQTIVSRVQSNSQMEINNSSSLTHTSSSKVVEISSTTTKMDSLLFDGLSLTPTQAISDTTSAIDTPFSLLSADQPYFSMKGSFSEQNFIEPSESEYDLITSIRMYSNKAPLTSSNSIFSKYLQDVQESKVDLESEFPMAESLVTSPVWETESTQSPIFFKETEIISTELLSSSASMSSLTELSSRTTAEFSTIQEPFTKTSLTTSTSVFIIKSRLSTTSFLPDSGDETSLSDIIAPTPTSASIPPLSTFESDGFEVSSSIYPIPMDQSTLLVLTVQMKPSVNISDPEVIQELENSLLECYEEGYNKLLQPTNRRKRRQDAIVGDGQRSVKVTDITRSVDDQSNVDVEFYVSENGYPLPSNDVENTFDQLSLVEISAYLTYPVISRPRAVTKATETDVDYDDTLIPILVVIPIVILIVAIAVIVIVIYCCRKSNHSNRMKTRHSLVPSLTLKKPTLDEMDLMIDMEKGEVVSRRSNTSTLNVKPGGSNTNTLSTALQKLQETGAEKFSEMPLRLNTIQYFQRSFSEMCSPQDRLERLKRLGLNVTEIHTRTLYQISEAHSNPETVTEVVAEQAGPAAGVDVTVIGNKDDSTPYYTLKTDDPIFDLSSSESNQSHPDDQNLIQLDREERLWNKVTFMANDGYISDSSPRNKTSSQTKRNKFETQQKHNQMGEHGDKHTSSKTKMHTSKERRKRDNVGREGMGGVSQRSRTSVQGYSNKIFEKPSNSTIPNSRHKGGYPYTESDSDSVCLPSSTPTWNSDSNFNSDLDTEWESLFDDFGRLRDNPYSSSRRFDHGLAGHDTPVEAVNDVMYKYFEPKERLHTIDRDNFYTDGSEYAGYEFDSVNFSSNYKPVFTPTHYKYYSKRRKPMEMAEPLVQYPEPSDPSALEHVTKMGRVGSRGLVPTYKPRFRPIPFQGQRKPPSPEPEPEPEPEPRVEPQPETFTIPVQPPIQSYEPYEEMKLGRNMRAVPRGGVRAVTSTNMQLDRDASEPLISTNPPSNIVVDYLANTTSSLTAPSHHKNGRHTSHQPSPRSVVTPQHPSQDLIEMLNRNQSMNISRFEEQQRIIEERQREEDRKAQEQIREQERKEEEERKRVAEEIERLERDRQEEEWNKQAEIRRMREQREEEYRLEIERKNQEELERKNREIQEERLRQERIEAEKQHERDIQTKNELLRDSFALSPPPQTSKDHFTPNTTQQREKSSDQGSSLPFIPHSGSFNYGTETGGSTLTTKTDTYHGKTDNLEFDKQETVDEVQDIEEDFEVEQSPDSDSDEFNHF